MQRKRLKKSGMALVSSIMLSSIIIIIMGVVLFRIVNTTKDVVNLQKNDAAKNIADEGLEHLIDWMNNRNLPKNYPLTESLASDLLQNITSIEFLQPMNSLSNISDMTPTLSLQTGETVYKRSSNALTTFPPLLGTNVVAMSLNGSSNPIIPELNNSSAKVFTLRGVSNSENKIKGDFQISMVPVVVSPANPKYDLIKVFSLSSVPSATATNKTVRKFVAIVQRPKDVKVKLDHAILSDGSVNLGNGNADGSLTPSSITLVTREGDVHTNGNLTLGPGGYVDGDASATGTITIDSGGTVTGTSTPNAPEKPIPKLDYANPFPATACVNSGTANDMRFNGPCTYTGDFNIAGSNTLTISDKVYINGDYKEAGNSKIISASPFAMLVVSGNLDTAGNGSTVATNRMAFVSTGGDMKVVGNGDIKGLFVNDNPNGSVSVTGNGNVFGGIISNGNVNFSGQNATVVRDLSLTNIPFKIPADAYSMRLVSWKELK